MKKSKIQNLIKIFNVLHRNKKDQKLSDLLDVI